MINLAVDETRATSPRPAHDISALSVVVIVIIIIILFSCCSSSTDVGYTAASLTSSQCMELGEITTRPTHIGLALASSSARLYKKNGKGVVQEEIMGAVPCHLRLFVGKYPTNVDQLILLSNEVDYSILGLVINCAPRPITQVNI